jgi:hypothetical protein
LLAIPQGKKEAFLKRAAEIGQPAWIVGAAVEGSGIDVVRD